MKVLYYSPSFENEKSSGGVVIRKRNLRLLKTLVGEENESISVYISPCSRIQRHTEILRKAVGVNIFPQRDLQLLAPKADIVFIDGTLHGAFSRSFLQKHRIIAFFHNVEYDYFCQEQQPPDRLLNKLKFKSKKTALYHYENRICRYSDHIITLNQRDSDRLKQLYGRGSDLILPTSMDDSYTENSGNPENLTEFQPYLLFIGSDFFGNTEGLFWFCDQCMPAIRAHLIVAGKGMDKYKDLYSPDQISFYGYTDDLAALYRNAAAVVLPIISGCGMKTKTCEAMMYGKVIFGTGEGFEGYQRSEDCILCENSKEFIEKINAYLEEGPRYFSSKNRALYLENYESNVVARKFYDFFSGVRG